MHIFDPVEEKKSLDAKDYIDFLLVIASTECPRSPVRLHIVTML